MDLEKIRKEASSTYSVHWPILGVGIYAGAVGSFLHHTHTHTHTHIHTHAHTRYAHAHKRVATNPFASPFFF